MPRWMRREGLVAGALAVCLCVLTFVVAFEPDPLPGEAAAIRWIQSWTGWARGPAEFVRNTTGTIAAILGLAIISLALAWRWACAHWLQRRLGFLPCPPFSRP